MSLIQPIVGRVVLLFTLLFVIQTARSQNTDIQSLSSALQGAIKSKNSAEASDLTLKLGTLSHEAGNHDQAKKYLLDCLSFSKKTDRSKNLIAASSLLGKIYFESADFNNAADYFSRSAEVATKDGNDEHAFDGYLQQSKSLAALKRYKRAIEPLEKALNIAAREGSIEKQLICYPLLETFYRESGNARKASEITALLASLESLREKESVARAEASILHQQATAALQEKAAQERVLTSQSEKLKLTEASLREVEILNQKNQLEIDLLSRDREVALLRIQEQNARLDSEAIFRKAILIVILLSSSLIGVLIVNYRKKVKTNKRIDLQNKNIKSSINYAKRIQEAMLPKKEVQESLLKNSFILFKPRDVVSGDFYWFSPLNDDGSDLVFGAIDCTGHGVPGAFMSMIGMNCLNSIVNRGVVHTNRILELLHQDIRSALQQDVTGNNDGMDLSLCIYRDAAKVLEFSGAKSPLVYVQDGTLHQIKGDIHSIGGSRSKNAQRYKKHSIPIDRPTMVYLFTDGYRDQFGGEENQKFMGKRFLNLLREIHHLPMQDQFSILNRTFDDWKGSGEQTDDVLVMGVLLTP